MFPFVEPYFHHKKIATGTRLCSFGLFIKTIIHGLKKWTPHLMSFIYNISHFWSSSKHLLPTPSAQRDSSSLKLIITHFLSLLLSRWKKNVLYAGCKVWLIRKNTNKLKNNIQNDEIWGNLFQSITGEKVGNGVKKASQKPANLPPPTCHAYCPKPGQVCVSRLTLYNPRNILLRFIIQGVH